ncbi:unnamed protein product [Allacma fusca]|uniref:Coiled-coil domain-containing protein 39 n=1 Tax=Allacma fusca TaxID=39272 RepID=A0A8J2JHW8_9HEXA|nr:unnamed protein product [Allacma fusca]
MISTHLSSLLSNLGWGSGFRLPVANDENKILENLLEQKQKRLLEVTAGFESDGHHCQILKGHFERMSDAVNQSQKMISAKRSEFETEQNLRGLADRMFSRIKNDYIAKAENIKEYQLRNKRMTDDVVTRRQLVEELIETVKFDQEALVKYKQVSEDKENYIKYMRTLTKLDDRVAQDFQLKFGKVGEELHDARITLNQSARYTQTLQQQFNRLCSQFRRVHSERSQAISYWENTLRSMQQRDEDIKIVAEEYADVRSQAQTIDEQCERSKSMLDAEKNNAMQLEYQIKTCDKACGDFRLKLSNGKEHTMSLNDDILTFNTIINQTSRIVKDVQHKILNHQNELDVMQQKLERAQTDLMAVKSRYDMTILETTSEENRTKEIEKMIEQEELKTEALLQEVEKQRRHLWQRSNDLNTLETKFKTTMNQIKGTKTIIISLRDRAKNDDIKVQKTRQQAYHLELECLTLESRIQQILTATPANASSIPIGDNVSSLKEKLLEVVKTKSFLTSQESHLQNINRRLEREIRNIITEHSNLKLTLETEKMETKRCGSDNTKTLEELQNSQVENRLLQMTLRRLTQIWDQERDKMLTLEQERTLLETAAKERQAEIDMHMTVLRTQQKLLKEDRNKLSCYVIELLSDIDRSKTRYEYIINAMNLYGDESGQSESYYILKHAQERETLKREGDLWDSKVKECEKEIAALQNTLSVLVSSNMAFKDSLAPAASETAEARMLVDMEEEQKIALVRKRKADKNIMVLNQTLLQQQTRHAESKHSKMFLEGLLAERKYELNNVHFEVANQKSKIDRANKMAARLIRELGLHVHEDREQIEADLKLRCAREKFEYGLKTLEKNLFLHEDIRTPAINFLLHSELEPIIARLKKRINAADGAASPFYSGQVTPVRYLTPINSTTVPQPIQSKFKDKLMEFRKMRERPNLPMLFQPSVDPSSSILTTTKVNPEQQIIDSKEVEPAQSVQEIPSRDLKSPHGEETTTIFKSVRGDHSVSEVDITHPTDLRFKASDVDTTAKEAPSQSQMSPVAEEPPEIQEPAKKEDQQ